MMDGNGAASEWAVRLLRFVGGEARLSTAATEPHAWTGLDAVTVRVRETWTVEDVRAERGDLVVTGFDPDGGRHSLRVPVATAFLGLDASEDFFLAGWRAEDGQNLYLRLERKASG